MAVQTPGRLPSQIIKLAAWTLPASHRQRYSREFGAELHFIAPEAQLRFSMHVLSYAWSLRSALSQAAPASSEGSTMTYVRNRTPLSCRLHMHHQWQRFFTDDGARYKACAKCGKLLALSFFNTNIIGGRQDSGWRGF